MPRAVTSKHGRHREGAPSILNEIGINYLRWHVEGVDARPSPADVAQKPGRSCVRFAEEGVEIKRFRDSYIKPVTGQEQPWTRQVKRRRGGARVTKQRPLKRVDESKFCEQHDQGDRNKMKKRETTTRTASMDDATEL
jgi:hypothetical protein